MAKISENCCFIVRIKTYRGLLFMCERAYVADDRLDAMMFANAKIASKYGTLRKIRDLHMNERYPDAYLGAEYRSNDDSRYRYIITVEAVHKIEKEP